MTPEGKVKDRVKNVLRTLRTPWTMTTTRGFGRNGVCDFIVNARGLYVEIETKALGSVGDPLQVIHIDKKVCAYGGAAFVVGADALRFVRASDTHDTTPFVYENMTGMEPYQLLEKHLQQLIKDNNR